MGFSRAWAAAIVFACGALACGERAGAAPLRVVATTTVLASLAGEVARGRADVTALIPIGASPETYQPAPSDVARLRGAGVVVENGAGLDAWVERLIAGSGTRARLVRCTDGLPVTEGNPHLWLDPVYARGYVERIRDAFVAADPDGASLYRSNAAAFDARLRALEAEIRRELGVLPPEKRGMIVFHNAWLYYDRRFGVRTLGVIQEVPGSEPSAAHLARLVDVARREHVRALFAEPEYDPRPIRAVARSAGITTIAVLYDDSLGPHGAGGYLDLMRLNTHTIVDALK